MKIYTSFVYYSRTKDRGLSPECDRVQDLVQAVKDGDRRAISEAADVLSGHPGLRGFRGVLVPAPRSSSSRPSNMAFAEALVARGVGTDVVDAVERIRPVESSRMRRRTGLPGVSLEEHVESMGVRRPVSAESVLVVDDIFTTGNTLKAVETVLRRAGFKGEVSGVTVGYFEASKSELGSCPWRHVTKTAASELPSFDSRVTTMIPPQDWTNPVVPPYSTENLSERFVDGAPSYLQASGPVLSDDEKWSFVGAISSPKGRIYVAAGEKERVRLYAGLEKAGYVRRMEGEGGSARFKDVALEYVYKLTAAGRRLAEGFDEELNRRKVSMDRISRIAEKVGRFAGMAVRVASAGFTQQANKDWDELVEWLRKAYPSEKFVSKEVRTGDYIWEKRLSAGSNQFVTFTTRGWDDHGSFEFWARGDYSARGEAKGKGPDVPPALADMKAVVLDVLAKSPEMRTKFMAEGLSPKDQVKMKALVDGAVATVREMLPAADFRSPWERGDVGSSYSLRLERDGAFMILEMDAKTGVGAFVVSALGNEVVRERYSDMASMARGLKGTKKLVQDGLRKLDKFSAGMMTGKVSADDLVRKVESVKARFEVVDEWVMTELEIWVKLATSSKVEKDMVEKWASRNWSQVLAKAPAKTPKSPEGRGMEHDEPSGKASYPAPNRVRWESREEVDWEQNGDSGVLKVMVSDR